VQSLRETLQQLAAVIASNDENVPLATNFAGQLKALLDSITAKTQSNQAVNQGAVQEDNAEGVQTATPNKATVDSVSATKDAATQTAVVIQEPRKSVQALRDPIWRFNSAEVTETEAVNSQAAAVTSAAGSGEASQSGSQPAWTFMQNDVTANTDLTTSKPALPAQVPVQQFASQMEKFLVKQFQLIQGNGTSEAKLSLTPEHLGQVDIRIVMQNGQLIAQFVTENPAARDLLENQMSQLRAALNGQGLQVERLEVVQQPANSASTTFMHQEQRHSNARNGNGNNGSGNGDAIEDPAVFAAELERNSSLKEFGYGSSINVTA
jgi:flagellar hook-length control protein FliK